MFAEINELPLTAIQVTPMACKHYVAIGLTSYTVFHQMIAVYNPLMRQLAERRLTDTQCSVPSLTKLYNTLH